MTAVRLLASCALTLLAACAQSARPLPPDQSSKAPEDRLQPGDREDAAFAFDCTRLLTEVKNQRALRQRQEAVIAVYNSSNQSLSYGAPMMGGLLGVGLAAGLSNSRQQDRDAYQAATDRIDRLQRISDAKHCPPTHSNLDE